MTGINLLNAQGKQLTDDTDPAKTLLDSVLTIQKTPDYITWWNSLSNDQQNYLIGTAVATPQIREAANVTKELWEVRKQLARRKGFPLSDAELSGTKISNRRNG